DTPLHLAACFGAPGSQRVYFIDEDDAGGAFLRLLEDRAQPRLAFPVKLVDDLRPVDVEEGRVRLSRDNARDQRLAGAGRATEQDAFGRLDAQAVENGGVRQRQLDHLTDALQLFAQPADIFVADAPGATVLRASCLRLDESSGLHQHRLDICDRLGLHRRLNRGQFARLALLQAIA